jgi:antitoxin (DNA-binding transcriptional repressor) of toxin-antitoxin stability system
MDRAERRLQQAFEIGGAACREPRGRFAVLYTSIDNWVVQQISVSDFRQKCLALMDNLPGDGILITRHGRPVAKLLPVQPSSCAELIGTVPGLATTEEDDLFSTGERWDAES